MRPSLAGLVQHPSLDLSSSERGKRPWAGNIALVPKADEDCFRHSVQWQWYSDIGAEVGVRKEMLPHWQRMFIASVLRVFGACVECDVPAVDVKVLAMACRRDGRFRCGVIPR